jgi:hypothetical protein
MQHALHVDVLQSSELAMEAWYSPLTCKSIADLATAAICGDSLQQ